MEYCKHLKVFEYFQTHALVSKTNISSMNKNLVDLQKLQEQFLHSISNEKI